MTYDVSIPHGIMFHHFHNETHPRGQGSISASQLDDLLVILKKTHNILDPVDWLDKSLSQSLGKRDICITLDDNLKCQLEIAGPVFKQHEISAFWFVYSSTLEGKPEYLEVFRFFRSKYYDDFDSFFEGFMQILWESDYDHMVYEALKSFEPSEYLKPFPFYSTNDRIFRYLRDHVLTTSQYNDLMLSMINQHQINIKSISENLWNTQEDLKELSNSGHYIGLHSHSHPTNLRALTEDEQEQEYTKNINTLNSFLSRPIQAMSHPCNSYNSNTLSILKNLGIRLGFRSNMEPIDNRSNLECPRIDHSILIKKFGL